MWMAWFDCEPPSGLAIGLVVLPVDLVVDSMR